MKKFLLKFDPLESSSWLGLGWIITFSCLGLGFLGRVMMAIWGTG